MKPPMLTVTEAAKRVGCNPQTLKRLMSSGKCPGAKIAGRWRTEEDEFEIWLQRQRPASTPSSEPTDEPLPRLEHNPFV